ncbi:SH3 domain-containing protein [Phragmitibacter flavus]|nr:SH3 domain-containing protein [Phragmitibacter flavus]
MKIQNWLKAVVLGLGMGLVGSNALAQFEGVAVDPDGFVNLRSEQDGKSKVVAKVKTGEVFEFTDSEGSPWWRVELGSGKSGWMYYDRIKFHATMDDLKDGDVASEMELYGKSKGVNYFALARKAAQGDAAGMKRYFGLNDTDGAAGEIHAAMINSVVHLLGDEKLSAFLAKQSIEYQLDVRSQWMSEVALWPFEPFGYAQRHFPKTAKLLLGKERVAWASPDGKYAIRKVFSDWDARENVKVDTAQIVDKTTGGVVADFSDLDIGMGVSREGRALWAEDSQKVALFVHDGLQHGNLLVFQRARGVMFENVELDLDELPGRAGDKQLKGAKLIFSRIEPLRWDGDVLMVQRHDYFEKPNADGPGNTGLGRTYELKVKVDGEGASVVGVEVLAE